MDDERRDSEPRDAQHDDPVTGPPTGRVRIIGAEPVSAAGSGTRDDARPSPDGDSDGTGGATENENSDGPESELSEPSVPDLPHWTEAPTGQVPAVLVRDRPDGEADDPWAAVPAPTWREEHSDWAAHDESFEPAMLAMDDPNIANIADRHDSLDEERQPWQFDLSAEEDADDTGADGEETDGETFTGDERDDERDDASGFPDDVADDETLIVRAPARGEGDDSYAATDDDQVEREAAPTGRADDDWAEAGEPLVVPGAGDQLLGIDDAGIGFEEILEGDDPRVMGESGILPASKRRLHMPHRRDRQRHPAPTATDEGLSDESAAAYISRPVPPAPAPAPRPAAPRVRPPVRPPAAHVPEPHRERNLVVAFIVGIVLGGVALLAFKLGNVATLVVATAVIFLATVEAYTGFRKGGYRPAVLLGWVAVVSLMVATYNKGQVALPLVLILVVALTMLWYVAGVERGADPLLNSGATLFVFCWIGVFGSYAALLLNPNLFPERHGIAFLVGAIIVTVIYDISALGVGSWIGSRQLAPSVSPGKTWEGAIGGGVAAVLAAVLLVHLIHPWTPGSAAALGVTVAVVAPLGDLFESVVKRNLGVKDMGRLLPGHGGFLDRIDGLLFVVPATYYLVKAFNLG